MERIPPDSEPPEGSPRTPKFYVVWIDSDGSRHAGGTAWSKYVAACFCASDHSGDVRSGLVREDRLFDWFVVDDPMSLTEDYKVTIKTRHVTLSSSFVEFNMRSKGNGVDVYRKGGKPVHFESDIELTGATKGRAYIDEWMQLASLQAGPIRAKHSAGH